MSRRVVVNPIACEAHGMCAELLPERIALDDWGYPIVDGRPLSTELVEHARRAAEACPTFALLIQAQGVPLREQARASQPAPPTVRSVRRRPEPVIRRQTRSDRHR
jgi:ferredoxin